MATYTLLRQTFGCMQMPVTHGETIIKLYVSKLLLFVVRKQTADKTLWQTILASLLVFNKLRLSALDNYKNWATFKEDAANGNLPDVAFIDPAYFSIPRCIPGIFTKSQLFHMILTVTIETVATATVLFFFFYP